MDAVKGQYYILNGKAAGTGDLEMPEPAAPYYEVLRVMDAVPLFVEDHLARLHNSVEKTGRALPDSPDLKKQISELIRLNNFNEGNIRINAFIDNEGRLQYCAFFIPHFYPEDQLYSEGVFVKSFRHTRPDPKIKKWDAAFRRAVNDFILSEKIFEALLIDEQGCFTEGSRSNLFFVDKKGRLLTAPEHKVLQGITKIKVEELCKETGIPVINQAICPRDLIHLDGCFLTGTSPRIMPVNQLDDIMFKPDLQLVQDIVKAYNGLIKDYILKYSPA